MGRSICLDYVDKKNRVVYSVPIRSLSSAESAAIYGNGGNYKEIRDRYITRITEIAEMYNYDTMLGELPVYFPHSCPEISVGAHMRHVIDVAHMTYGDDYTPVWGIE